MPSTGLFLLLISFASQLIDCCISSLEEGWYSRGDSTSCDVNLHPSSVASHTKYKSTSRWARFHYLLLLLLFSLIGGSVSQGSKGFDPRSLVDWDPLIPIFGGWSIVYTDLDTQWWDERMEIVIWWLVDGCVSKSTCGLSMSGRSPGAISTSYGLNQK